MGGCRVTGRDWLCVLTFGLGLAVGGWLMGTIKDTTHEQYKVTVANDAKDRALAVLMSLQAAGAKVQAAEQAISNQRETNAKATELQAAENDRLTRCLKSGTCGLRVAARCPSVPSAATSDGTARDPGGTARLTAAAESDYLEFRRKYAEQLATLRMCRTFGETKKPSQ